MTARRETKWEQLRDTLRFVVAPGRKLVPLLIVFALIGYLLFYRMQTNAERPIASKEGRIVRFGLQSDPRNFAPSSIAIVRAADGTTSEVPASPEKMARCRIGDLITYTTGPQGTQIDRCAP